MVVSLEWAATCNLIVQEDRTKERMKERNILNSWKLHCDYSLVKNCKLLNQITLKLLSKMQDDACNDMGTIVDPLRSRDCFFGAKFCSRKPQIKARNVNVKDINVSFFYYYLCFKLCIFYKPRN